MSAAQRLGLRERLFLLATALLALHAIGCGGGLQVTKLSSIRGTPSNVAVFMSVERDGQPVTGLKPDDFAVFEDGAALSKADAQVSLQPVDVGAVTHTLILVDRSGAGAGVVGAKELTAIEGLVERAAKVGKVAVYGFDGDEAIHPIIPFTDEVENAPFGAIAAYTPKDASSNLHGAVLRGVEELEASLADEPESLRFGALVVVAGATDRAARKSLDDVTSTLGGSKHGSIDVFTISAPAAAEARLQKIGKAGAYQIGPELSFAAAATRTAASIESHWKRYYLLSYCTPARKGEHKVRVEVRSSDPPVFGSIGYSFVADGMGPGCNPDKPPKFAGLDTSSDGPIRKDDGVDAAPAVADERVASASATVTATTKTVVAAQAIAATNAAATLSKIASPAKLGAETLAPAAEEEASEEDASSDDTQADDGSSDDKKKGAKKPKKKKGDKDKHDKDKHEKKGDKHDKPEAKKAEAKKPEPKKAAPKPAAKKKK